MTRDEFLAANERRYWRELVCCYRTKGEVARHAGVHRCMIWTRFRKLGIPDRLRLRPPPDERLSEAELLLSLREFLLEREAEYFRALMAQGLGATRMSEVAGLDRSAVYKRMHACGITPEEANRLSGRKRYGGNDAWRSLAHSPEPRAHASR